MADARQDDKELESLKKLPPKERLKKLEELEAKKKKEAEESKKLMQKMASESLKELKLDEMLKEIEVPKEEKIDIDRLFIEEEEMAQKAAAENKDYLKAQSLSREQISEIQQWYSNGAAPEKKEFLEVYQQVTANYESLKREMERKDYTRNTQAQMEELVDSRKLLRSLGYKHRWLGGHSHIERE